MVAQQNIVRSSIVIHYRRKVIIALLQKSITDKKLFCTYAVNFM